MDFNSLVLYHEKDLIVINKPPGILAQKDKSGDPSIIEIVENHLSKPAFIINRLDRPASGVMLLTSDANLCAKIQEAWQQNQVTKTYIAIVEGIINKSQDTLNHKIKKGRSNKAVLHREGKKSILEYEVISRLQKYSILQINLITGRFHQIRLQLSTIGHPIRGDVKYGARRKNKDRSIHLHCRKIKLLEFPEFIAPFPENVPLWDIVTSMEHQ
jgi:23S rRNA pseudouridine1911/1915/1917 synthase